jgi:hypothetical protein
MYLKYLYVNIFWPLNFSFLFLTEWFIDTVLKSKRKTNYTLYVILLFLECYAAQIGS